jgi:magnesium transporter
VSELEHSVGRVMVTDVVTMQARDKAAEAAKAIERYDLVSAPVVDENGKLVGRVTIDKVVDFIRAKSESDLLTQAVTLAATAGVLIPLTMLRLGRDPGSVPR